MAHNVDYWISAPAQVLAAVALAIVSNGGTALCSITGGGIVANNMSVNNNINSCQGSYNNSNNLCNNTGGTPVALPPLQVALALVLVPVVAEVMVPVLWEATEPVIRSAAVYCLIIEVHAICHKLSMQ